MPQSQKKPIATKRAAKKTLASRPRSRKSVAPSGNAGQRRRGPRGGLTDAHKAQLARGREEARIVRAYLESVDAPKPRGRRPSPEAVKRQLDRVREQLRGARGVDKLTLLKERRDLEATLGTLRPAADHNGLEREFVKVARGYSERRGIDYSVWREMGIRPAVLSKAGITRSGRSATRR
ncbi:MAG: hypothetical protein M0010_06720 [Actinomycetota bacterium]|nr:hypothetical protein [Actinomycetota bacterium]MDA8356929.1 hypothetical protein [Actinomycetota bacterium]